MADEAKPEVEVKPEIIHFVLLGRDPHNVTVEKKTWRYGQLTSIDENDGRELSQTARGMNLRYYKTRPRFMIGSVISVEGTESSIYPSTMRLVGHWKNKEDVTKWNAITRAIESQEETEKQSIKAIKKQLPEELLTPFRKAYHSVNTNRQRAHILAWVIEEITRYRPNDEK